MEILKTRFLPPPFNSISTISIPSDCATRSAMASIFERIAVLLMLRPSSNKKVGFRPLQEFDTYTSIVACPEENATFGCGCGAGLRPAMPPVVAACLRKPRHAGSKAVVAGQRPAPLHAACRVTVTFSPCGCLLLQVT